MEQNKEKQTRNRPAMVMEEQTIAMVEKTLVMEEQAIAMVEESKHKR